MIEQGDILRICGEGAPGYAELGDLVRVVETDQSIVRVETRQGEIGMFGCEAECLEKTEWRNDFPE